MPVRKTGDRLDGMGLEICPDTWGRSVARKIDRKWLPGTHRPQRLSRRHQPQALSGEEGAPCRGPCSRL